MEKKELLQIKIPENIGSEIRERVRLGLYSDESEVVNKALRKAFAEEARQFLRELIRQEGLSEKEMIEEWRKVRG